MDPQLPNERGKEPDTQDLGRQNSQNLQAPIAHNREAFAHSTLQLRSDLTQLTSNHPNAAANMPEGAVNTSNISRRRSRQELSYVLNHPDSPSKRRRQLSSSVSTGSNNWNIKRQQDISSSYNCHLQFNHPSRAPSAIPLEVGVSSRQGTWVADMDQDLIMPEGQANTAPVRSQDIPQRAVELNRGGTRDEMQTNLLPRVRDSEQLALRPHAQRVLREDDPNERQPTLNHWRSTSRQVRQMRNLVHNREDTNRDDIQANFPRLRRIEAEMTREGIRPNSSRSESQPSTEDNDNLDIEEELLPPKKRMFATPNPPFHQERDFVFPNTLPPAQGRENESNVLRNRQEEERVPLETSPNLANANLQLSARINGQDEEKSSLNTARTAPRVEADNQSSPQSSIPREEVSPNKSPNTVNTEAQQNSQPDGQAAATQKAQLSANESPNTAENTVPCDECGKRFCNQESVYRHKRLQHRDDAGALGSFQCPECKQPLKSEQNLERHRSKAHSEGANIPCDECDAKFSTDRSVRMHRKLVHGYVPMHKRGFAKKSHTCSYDGCTYASDQKPNVERHKKSVHEKRRDFPCPVCGYCASTKNNLQAHQMTHQRDDENRAGDQGPERGGEAAA